MDNVDGVILEVSSNPNDSRLVPHGAAFILFPLPSCKYPHTRLDVFHSRPSGPAAIWREGAGAGAVSAQAQGWARGRAVRARGAVRMRGA